MRFQPELPCHTALLQSRAGAKASVDIGALRSEEVSVARVRHARYGGAAGTPQNRTGAKPGRRIVTVRVGLKTGVGVKGAGGPFPNVAPLKAGVGERCFFPLGFGRQCAPCALAPGLYFRVAQVTCGGIQVQCNPLPKVALLPDEQALRERTLYERALWQGALAQIAGPDRLRTTAILRGGQMAQITTPADNLVVNFKRRYLDCMGDKFIVKRKARCAFSGLALPAAA